jgi:hypothetical protein
MRSVQKNRQREVRAVRTTMVFFRAAVTSLLLLGLLSTACSSSQLSRTIGEVSDMWDGEELTTGDVIEGLKEALVQGAGAATDQASAADGYLKNLQIRIPFPPEIEKVETTLRDIGLDREVDRFILSMNRAAERAAERALPIFTSAVRSMTIEDGWAILRGEDDAATRYLDRTTRGQLSAEFQPVVKEALDTVNATRYYADVMNLYNSLPFVEPVNPNLDEYVTDRAIDGLFLLMAAEEARIRQDPLARTTELMSRVFAEQD